MHNGARGDEFAPIMPVEDDDDDDPVLVGDINEELVDVDFVPGDIGVSATGVWRVWSMEAVDDDDAPLGHGEPRRSRRRTGDIGVSATGVWRVWNREAVDDDDAPLGDGEPRRSRRRTLPPQPSMSVRLQRRNCEDPLNFADDSEDEEK